MNVPDCYRYKLLAELFDIPGSDQTVRKWVQESRIRKLRLHATTSPLIHARLALQDAVNLCKSGIVDANDPELLWQMCHKLARRSEEEIIGDQPLSAVKEHLLEGEDVPDLALNIACQLFRLGIPESEIYKIGRVLQQLADRGEAA